MSKSNITLEQKELADGLQDKQEKQVQFPAEPGSFIVTKEGLFAPNLNDEAVKKRIENIEKLKKDKTK